METRYKRCPRHRSVFLFEDSHLALHIQVRVARQKDSSRLTNGHLLMPLSLLEAWPRWNWTRGNDPIWWQATFVKSVPFHFRGFLDRTLSRRKPTTLLALPLFVRGCLFGEYDLNYSRLGDHFSIRNLDTRPGITVLSCSISLQQWANAFEMFISQTATVIYLLLTGKRTT